ncbi:hypothetical protein DBR11_27300, partial [Pedobacter sp. HMWF019]|uniref:hypothetical protein n=1 Tax=Pedobacter sp. HMWF019 TaxID=2056856 RepID=UPI000D40B7D8
VIELENDNTNSLNYKDITIFRLPQDELEFLTIEKSTEIEDPVISISQKFIQEEDEQSRAESEQRLLEKRLAEEHHINSMVDVFERKISETKKPGKKKKKKKSLWKKLTNFFAVSNDEDDENEGSDRRSDKIDKTSASDVNSITDKF